eukprot:scaffold15717_cov43-Prasinocladus_malaysianus.AAC.3
MQTITNVSIKNHSLQPRQQLQATISEHIANDGCFSAVCSMQAAERPSSIASYRLAKMPFGMCTLA